MFNKKEEQKTRWMKWAVAEGGTKTANRLISKFLGVVTGSFFGAVLATLITAVVQTIGGFFGSLATGQSLKIPSKQLIGSVVFGINAAIMGWLTVFVFTYPGADIGVVTFMVTASIIPGAFLDWIFFSHPLKTRQWLGVIIFLFAGWAILDFPGLAIFSNLPPWLGWAIFLPLLLAINEAITQAQGRAKLRPLHPLVSNFWIGLTTILVSGIALIFLIHSLSQFITLPLAYWIGSIAKGIIAVGMISFKLLSYKWGGSIALKKLIMHSTYLVSATLLGAMFYADESLTFGKLVGILIFFVAFIFTDDETWKYLILKLKSRKRFFKLS